MLKSRILPVASLSIQTAWWVTIEDFGTERWHWFLRCALIMYCNMLHYTRLTLIQSIPIDIILHTEEGIKLSSVKISINPVVAMSSGYISLVLNKYWLSDITQDPNLPIIYSFNTTETGCHTVIIVTHMVIGKLRNSRFRKQD